MLSPTELITHSFVMYSIYFFCLDCTLTFSLILSLLLSLVFSLLIFFFWPCHSKLQRRMVPEAGIEPTTFGLEGHCSSAELLGHISLSLSSPISSCFLYLYVVFFFRFLFLFQYYLFFLHQKNLNIKILAATYSRTSMRCTTIGTSWLNFCVRYGNRCTSTVLTTKILTLRPSHIFLLLHNLNN